MLLCLHAYIHERACMLQEYNFKEVLCSAMRDGESHIVQQFLSCTGLPEQLDLVSCRWRSAIVRNIAQSWKFTLPLSFCIVMLTAQTLIILTQSRFLTAGIGSQAMACAWVYVSESHECRLRHDTAGQRAVWWIFQYFWCRSVANIEGPLATL